MEAGRLEGLIPLAGGVIAYLIYFGVIPMKHSDTWKPKFGRLILIAAPISILFGLAQLSGILK